MNVQALEALLQANMRASDQHIVEGKRWVIATSRFLRSRFHDDGTLDDRTWPTPTLLPSS